MLPALGAVGVALCVVLGGELARTVPTVGLIVGLLLVSGSAALLVARGRALGRGTVVVILVAAAAMRLALAVHAPVLSSDVYRYVWDGRVQAHDVNPYRYAPDAVALAPLRDPAVYDHISRRGVPTIYPPVAEASYRVVYAVHNDSVVWTKLAFSGLDLGSIGLLLLLLPRLGLRPERAVLYAWHPLAIVEIAGSGHVDAVAIPLVLLALLAFLSARRAAVGVAIAAAALVKPYALVVLPALLRRPGRLRVLVPLAATVVLAYLPFASAGTKVLGYLPGYAGEEGIASGSRYYLLGRVDALVGGSLPVAAYDAFVLAVLGVLALRIARGEAGDLPSRMLLLFVTALVLLSPAYPWYALIGLALLPLARGIVLVPALAVLSTVELLYGNLKLEPHPAWPLHVVWGGGALALALSGAWALAAARRRTRASPRRTARPLESQAPNRRVAWPRRRVARLPAGTRR